MSIPVPDEIRMLTVDEAAEILRIHPNTAYRESLEKGTIGGVPVVRAGRGRGTIRIPRDKLEKVVRGR